MDLCIPSELSCCFEMQCLEFMESFFPCNASGLFTNRAEADPALAQPAAAPGGGRNTQGDDGTDPRGECAGGGREAGGEGCAALQQGCYHGGAGQPFRIVWIQRDTIGIDAWQVAPWKRATRASESATNPWRSALPVRVLGVHGRRSKRCARSSLRRTRTWRRRRQSCGRRSGGGSRKGSSFHVCLPDFGQIRMIPRFPGLGMSFHETS